MRIDKESIRIYIVRNRATIGVLCFILVTVLIPILSFILIAINIEEPYFIIIDSNEDFQQWCDTGNGTVENPYIIEGHTITVPENWETEFGDHTTTCVNNPLISISGVTKSFIIQNNTLTMNNLCGGSIMIQIYNTEVPFIIRNNKFKASNQIKRAIYLTSVNASNSQIINNEFNRADLFVRESSDLFITHNQFYNLFNYNYVRDSSNISFQNNLFSSSDLEMYECSDITLHNNTFKFLDTMGQTIYGYHVNYTRFTNNSFFNAGVGVVNSDYIPKIFGGNMINGKPLGFFYNQSNLIINNTTTYGQIILLECKYSSIVDQTINNTYYATQVLNCLNITISNCSFSKTSIYVRSSNNTFILDNIFKDSVRSLYLYYSNGVHIKRNLFKNIDYSPHIWECTAVVEEDNIIQ